MKIMIAGGGIGGLVAAIALHKAGFEVKVFESVQELQPLGVGINLLPHSVRILTNLGLAAKLAQVAVETRELVYANKWGQFFWKEPRGKFAGYKWQQFSIHRGILQMLLLEEATRLLGEEKIKTNHHLSEFMVDAQSVQATFIETLTGKRQSIENGDLLIGADGIHSVVRKQLYPDEGEVKYSGNVLYRGTTMMPPFLTEASMAMIGHNRMKMVVYPIQTVGENNLQMINWVGNLKEGKEDQLKARDWNRHANKQRLLNIYKDWCYDWLDVPAMIMGAENIYEFPMSDRDPLPRWSFDRVTLLGDAAHPMYPIGSNGASQAILDAEAITNALLVEKNLSNALHRYDQQRLPATENIVLKNRQKGPDAMMDLMEDRFPQGFTEDQIPKLELADIMSKYKQIAGFDMKTLNAKS